MHGLIKLVNSEERGALSYESVNFFLGLTTGAIAGAVTVLYSTPKSGDEFRSTVSADWQDHYQELKIKLAQLKILSLLYHAKQKIKFQMRLTT